MAWGSLGIAPEALPQNRKEEQRSHKQAIRKKLKQKITEDDPRWNWKTMGNKRGHLNRKKLAIQKGLAKPKQDPSHFDQI